VPGSGLGPHPDALSGDGRPSGRDDDIGFFAAAIAPGALRGGAEDDAARLFGALLDCPPADPAEPVRYPGWHEHRSIRERMRDGVPIDPELHAELTARAADAGVAPPRRVGEDRWGRRGGSGGSASAGSPASTWPRCAPPRAGRR